MAYATIDYTGSVWNTNSVFTTPPYLEGRTQDISVAVRTIGANTFTPQIQGTHYTLTGTEVKFLAGHVPVSTSLIRITRSSFATSRLVDYQDGARLQANTLDLDSNQNFFIAQEALDEAFRVNLSAESFYTSGNTAPLNPNQGDLWFDTSTAYPILKVYDGAAWDLINTSVVSQKFVLGEMLINIGNNLVFDGMNHDGNNSQVFLNGVKLVQGTNGVGGASGNFNTDAGVLQGDYYFEKDVNPSLVTGYNSSAPLVVIKDVWDSSNSTFATGFTTDDFVEVISIVAGNSEDVLIKNGVTKAQATTTGLDVTGTINADGLTLGDSDYIKIGAGNDAGIPDLQIFSGGGNAFIEQPSGSGNNNLIIRGQSINLRNDADATILQTDNDQVRMWTQVAGSEDSSNSAAKFSTTTTGISVNGTVTTNALTMGDNEKITLGTGGDLEIYHDGSHSHILDKGTGSFILNSAHFALRSGATDDADTTPTEHIRMQVLAGATGTTAFSAGNESSGSLSTGMTNPRLLLRPITGSNAGEVVVNGRLFVASDPIDSSKTGSGDLGVMGDISATNLDLSGNIEVEGEISRSGAGNIVIKDSVEIKRTAGTATTLSILHTGTSLPSNAVLELGGTNGAHMDFKEPSSDDYDLRIEHGVNADNESLITSKHPLIVQTQAGGGDVKIKREGVEKLATSVTGIDVNGTITSDVLDLSGNTTGSNTNPVEVLSLPTNSKIEFDNTFSIQHRTYSEPYAYIRETGSGGLRLEGASLTAFTNDGTSDGIPFDKLRMHTSAGSTGNVKLYYGNEANFANHKFETTSTGVNVVGTVTADNFTLFRDDNTTPSLEIFTDSNNDTFIQERDADNGSLKILGTALQLRSDDLRLMNRAGTDVYFEGDADGAAKLFYDSSTHGTAKLETTATGINVTGTVTSDGLRLGNNQSLQTLKTDGGTALTIYTDATYNHTYIDEAGGGNLVIDADAFVVRDKDSNGQNRRIVASEGSTGSVSLYYGNIGNADSDAKLNTTATGISVNGTVTATSITSAPTTVVTTNNTVPTVAVNKKYIDTYDSGVNAYVLPTGTVGQMITFVNASTQNITLNRNTNSITLEKIIAGSDPANVTDNTITVGKSGAVEVVYTGTNTAIIFGSGIS